MATQRHMNRYLAAQIAIAALCEPRAEPPKQSISSKLKEHPQFYAEFKESLWLVPTNNRPRNKKRDKFLKELRSQRRG